MRLAALEIKPFHRLKIDGRSLLFSPLFAVHLHITDRLSYIGTLLSYFFSCVHIYLFIFTSIFIYFHSSHQTLWRDF